MALRNVSGLASFTVTRHAVLIVGEIPRGESVKLEWDHVTGGKTFHRSFHGCYLHVIELAVKSVAVDWEAIAAGLELHLSIRRKEGSPKVWYPLLKSLRS